MSTSFNPEELTPANTPEMLQPTGESRRGLPLFRPERTATGWADLSRRQV